MRSTGVTTTTQTWTKETQAIPQRRLDGLLLPPVKVAIRPLQGQVLPERASDVQRWRSGPIPPVPLVGSPQGEGTGPSQVTIDTQVGKACRVLASLRSAQGSGAKLRSKRRASARTLASPPEILRKTWGELLEAVDDYLDQPPARTSAIQMVRTKVALDTELQADGKHWEIPSDLHARIRSRMAYLEHRIDQARQSLKQVKRGRDLDHLVWPIDPVVVNSEFGWREHPISGKRKMHYGLDLDGYEGEVITAAGPGVVLWAGWLGGHGKHVEIMHPGGWVTRYSHMSHIMVRVGDRLETGDSLGFVGSTGYSTGPHLHFEVWKDGEVMDPSVALGAPPFTLELPGIGYGG